MDIELLDRLHDSGELRDLVHSGLVSPSVIKWRKIYHAYNLQINKGVKKTQAITDIGDVFDVSEKTVYLVLKKFKK